MGEQQENDHILFECFSTTLYSSVFHLNNASILRLCTAVYYEYKIDGGRTGKRQYFIQVFFYCTAVFFHLNNTSFCCVHGACEGGTLVEICALLRETLCQNMYTILSPLPLDLEYGGLDEARCCVH